MIEAKGMIKYMSEKKINEKKMLICIIGTLEAIKKGALSITESEKFLFSPHMIVRLKEKNIENRSLKYWKKDVN